MANPRRRSRATRNRAIRTLSRRHRRTPEEDVVAQDDIDEERDAEEIEEEEDEGSSSSSTEGPPISQRARTFLTALRNVRNANETDNSTLTPLQSRTSKNKRPSKLPPRPTYVAVKGWRWLYADDCKSLVKVMAEIDAPIRAISLGKTEEVKGTDSSNSIGKRYLIMTDSFDLFIEEDEYLRVRKIVLPNEPRPEPAIQRPNNALYGMEIT